ncbi:MAG: hypothetical protein IPN77_19270 [Sandaracinaceae bacterium]|nr:hypothetical protein [Sandaracinaceae bacterium]
MTWRLPPSSLRAPPGRGSSLYSAEAQPGPQLRERGGAGHGPRPATGETLGDRMSHALSMGIARCGAALVLGTDVPTPPAAHPPHCP